MKSESSKVKRRREWVELFNSLLPQEKWYDEEFEIEMSMGVGGIYDSEYMNYVYDNFKSNRIKNYLKEFNIK